MTSAFFTSLLTQFISLLITSAYSVLGSLLFFLFISFSKYSFHLFNTASEVTITLLYIFPCSVSLPSQSVQLLFAFYLQSSIQIVIARPFAIATPSLPYSSFLCISFLVFSSLILCHAFFASFFLCFSELPHPTTMSPCLHFISQMSLPVQFQLFLLAFLLFCPTHQVTHSCLPKSWSPLF